MAWDNDYETPKSKEGMWDGWSLDDLHKAAKTAHGKRAKEINFAIRAKTGWGKVGESEMVTESKNWDKMSPESQDIVRYAETHPKLRKDMEKILDHLAKDKKGGTYDCDHAVGCYKFHADKAAMMANKDHGAEDGSLPWHKQFKDHHRNEAAKHWEDLNREHLDRRHEMMHESVNEELAAEEKKSIYAMLQAAIEDRPADFQEHFENAIQPRLSDRIDAATEELRKFMFNHLSGNQMEGVNCKSKMLLSNKAKKVLFTSKEPALTVDLPHDHNDFDFDGPFGTPTA